MIFDDFYVIRSVELVSVCPLINAFMYEVVFCISVSVIRGLIGIVPDIQADLETTRWHVFVFYW